MMTGGGNNGFMSDINVTPFVDVMLVLLIIFMVTAPMMVQGVNVDLPEVTAKPLDSEEENLVVSIDADGRIFINELQVAPEGLADKLGKVLEGGKEPAVYLKADKSIPYGVVVGVMADIKSAGVEKLGMVTLPGDEKEEDRAGRSDRQ
ncbi:MAG: protein TolR [Desulfobacterales bacterium]